MTVREISKPPSSLELYLRAALPLVPGASRVPLLPVPKGRSLPDLELVMRDVRVDAGRLEVVVGGDDWALEGFAAGATGWITGVGVLAPRETVELYDAVQANDLARARDVYRRLLPVARFDMTSKLVQYFKAAQDAVGFNGGPTRAPRLPLKADERAALDTALEILRQPAAV